MEYNPETNARVLRIQLLNKRYPIYWDEFISFHRDNGKRWLFKHQYRWYRTWKYTRKTQWKE